MKRIELIQPIQEKVFNAIEEIAETRNFAFVFDKASGATILYAQTKFDISDDVLDEIGSVMQTVKRDQRQKTQYKSSSSSNQSQQQTQSRPTTTPPPPGGRKK